MAAFVVLSGSAAAEAAVGFDRAFGVGVDTFPATPFESCTTASTCNNGVASGDAGGMNVPLGVAVDAQGRILVADTQSNRIDRFTVADDGTVGFDRAFGVGVDTYPATRFESCTTASTCNNGVASGAAGGMNGPQGVAVDAQGRILVADTQSNRVDRFLPGPLVTVTTSLVPATDAGRFDLLLDGTLVHAGAGNGEQGLRYVADGSAVSVSEAGAAGTSPADYQTTIDCGSGPQPGPSVTLPDLTGDVGCTITNTRRRTVTVRSALSPAGDPGRFDLRVDGRAVAVGAGDGGAGSVVLLHGARPVISQAAAAGTDAADYDSAVACDNGQTATGSTLTLGALTGDVVCTITNRRKPGPAPTPTPTPTPTRDTTSPLIRKLGETNGTFAVGTAPRVASPREPPVGTTFHMILSERSTVTISFNRISLGRRVGNRCVTATAKNRNARKCTRRIVAGRLTRMNRPAGELSIPFSGRLGARALATGSYEAVVVTIDAAKNRSKPKTLRFTIVTR